MNHDEFAFFNRQLAAMLRDGIPLEGALKQLCTGLKSAQLRSEMQSLEADLARGTPLADALAGRSLPEFYKRMVSIGARSQDLPEVLTMIADHYQQSHALWTRLKGLMVYPVIVILVSLGLTLIVSTVFSKFLGSFFADGSFGTSDRGWFWVMCVWVPPALLAMAAIVLCVVLSLNSLRSKLRWWLPGFREASLAQLASALSLMIRNGTPLPDALALAQSLEAGSPMELTLAHWRESVASGAGKPAAWSASIQQLPPLFVWLVRQSGEDIAAGFRKAAEVYQARASYRIEMALYGALPVSILLLGQMVFWQIAPVFQGMTWLMNMIGGVDGVN